MQSYKKKVVWRGEVKKNSPPWPLKSVNGIGGVINPYTAFCTRRGGMFCWFARRPCIRFVYLSHRRLGVMAKKGVHLLAGCLSLPLPLAVEPLGCSHQSAFPFAVFVCLCYLCVVWCDSKNFTLCCLGLLVLVLFFFYVHLSEIHDVLPTSSCPGALRVGHVCQVLGVIPLG